MASDKKFKVGLLGASGYTGADLMRLGACHPNIEIKLLTANAHAGKPVAQVYPHLCHIDLPDMVSMEEARWDGLDAVFCGLPHGTTQDIIAQIHSQHPAIKIIDMSADFRLRDVELYAQTYGHAHRAPDLQPKAAYGLSEFNRDAIGNASIIACPGCFPTAVLLGLLPLVKSGGISTEDMIIDAKSGTSGAGRSPKQNLMFSETGESAAPYAIGVHRHAPEIEQEISTVTGKDVVVNFTPHLVPMSRGELITAHVKMTDGTSINDLRATFVAAYKDEPFVTVAAEGAIPSTAHVRGSNFCLVNVFADRIAGRAIVISAVDNLVKGSAGQAIQNFNIAFGLDETTGLTQLPMFP